MASTPSQQQHNSMPLLWHSRSEFWELFDNEYGAQQRQLAQYFHLPLALSAIRARIAQPPEFTPLEESFPGPVERWYGQVGEHLFVLTHYYSPDGLQTVVVTEDTQEAIAAVTSLLKEWCTL